MVFARSLFFLLDLSVKWGDNDANGPGIHVGSHYKEAEMKRILSVLFLALFVFGAVPLFAGGQGEDGEDVYRVGVIPKFIAEDYFIAAENGFRAAEEDLGNVQVDWVGDTMSQTSAANQNNYIQSFIDREYDAILVSALDPESYADTLQEARDMGILVGTWDADVRADARDFFVNQAEFEEIGICKPTTQRTTLRPWRWCPRPRTPRTRTPGWTRLLPSMRRMPTATMPTSTS